MVSFDRSRRRTLYRQSKRLLARLTARRWRGGRRALQRRIRDFLRGKTRAYFTRLLARPGFAVVVAAGILVSGQAAAEPPIALSNVAAGEGGFVMTGFEALGRAGLSVAGAGDINGDGIPDVVVGVPRGSAGTDTYSGQVFVVFGKPDTVAVDLSLVEAGTGGFVINGGGQNEYAGYSVAILGDLTGDGKDEIVIHASQADANAAYAGTASASGRTYVVFGKSTTSSLSLNTIESGTGGFVINGDGVVSLKEIANAGDVNGDGKDDVVIGSPLADVSAIVDAGRTYVVFGKSSTGAVDLSSIVSGTGGFVIDGFETNQKTGFSVDGAGDVNGDGKDDIVIGAPYAEFYGQVSAGEGYVVFGKADTGAVNLGNLRTGTGGFWITGAIAGQLTGFSVAGVGDTNGDGKDDVAIGATGVYVDGTSESGAAYVIFGKTTTTPATVGNAMIGNGGFAVLGTNSFEKIGSEISGAGDVNGDGLDDILLGAAQGTGAASGSTYAGKAYVMFGRTVTGFMSVSTTDFLDSGIWGFSILGDTAYDGAGIDVSAAGDMNGDGAADLLVGAHKADPGSVSEAGEAYVIFSPVPVPVNIGVRQSGTSDPVLGVGVHIERTDAPIGFTSAFSGFAANGAAIYRTAPADVVDYLVRASAPGFIPSTALTVRPDDTGETAATIDLLPDTNLAQSSILRVVIDLLDENDDSTGHQLLTKTVQIRDGGANIGLVPVWGQGEMIFLGVPNGSLEVFVPDTADLLFTGKVINVGTGVDKTVTVTAKLASDPAPRISRAALPGLVVGAVQNSSASPAAGLEGALIIHTHDTSPIATFVNSGAGGVYFFPDALEGAGAVQAFSQDAGIEGTSKEVAVVAGQVFGDGDDEDTLLTVPLESGDRDFDGLPDTFEDAYFGSVPADEQGPDDDPDSDGLTNFDEYTGGTDPAKLDTDFDTYADGAEILLGSNPASNLSTPAAQSLVYVDFGFADLLQAGTLMNPFDNLDDAVAAVAVGGTIRIKGDVDLTTGPVPASAIGKNVTLEAFRGTIRVQ